MNNNRGQIKFDKGKIVETEKRVILRKAREAGSNGFPIAQILSAVKKWISAQEKALGLNASKIDEIIKQDDITRILMELKNKGNIRVAEGKIYYIKN